MIETALGKKDVVLAVVGNANSPVTWSGIPFHLLQAGKRSGFLDQGLNLAADSWIWRLRRGAWNAVQVGLHFQRLGGYQYSQTFLERLWSPWRGSLKGAAVINCFQLFPDSLVADDAVEKWFYIDMTLTQLYGDYGIARSTGSRIRSDARIREGLGYRAAAGVICHSRWAAESVIGDYGVHPEKVHVVVPGANIDLDEYERWRARRERQRGASADKGPTLRLVSVGKEWRRKGLDRLLLAHRAAVERGADLSLTVIGCDPSALPEELRRVPKVHWAGFVDKRTDIRAFLDLVGGADLGCHLSRAEAGGMAQREYHALGLGVIGTVVGGAAEHRIADASIDVPQDASTDIIADKLWELWREPGRVERLKQSAWQASRSVLWPAAVERLQAVIDSKEGPAVRDL